MEQLLTKLLGIGTAHTAHKKQQCKQLLHALLNVSQKHFEGYVCAPDTYISHSKQLLKVLQPHLQLPHPYGSITATCMAYQILERLLQHLCAQAQHTIKQEQLQPCEGPDEQQSRDTNTAAPPAHCPADPGLLCQLHACSGLCWQAIVSKPSDLGLARHVLQYHAAAHSCLVLIHQYCKPAGIGPQLQELLLGLLLHGTLLQLSTADSAAAAAASKASGLPGFVVIKTEPTTASQHNQQQDQTAAAGQPPAVPLLAGLKLLMRSSKAHAAAAKASTRSRTPQPADPAPHHGASGTTATAAAAAGAGAGGRSPAGGALQSAVAATVAARAEELSVSGIKAWGLIAAELGPKLLDKAVGQPMLDVSATQSNNSLTKLLQHFMLH